MSLAQELTNLAHLLTDAANTISEGVSAAFADEEDQHPAAQSMRAVERRCRHRAEELLRAAQAMRQARADRHQNV